MFNFHSKFQRFGRKFLVLLTLCTFTAMGLVVSLPTASFALTGAGTIGDPYLVTSCADLLDVDDDLTAAYRLTTTIDCAANGSAAMIGDGTANFVGSFDGGDNTITVDIDFEDNFIGLFRKTSDPANIHDLTVAGTVAGDGFVGGLIGSSTDTTLDNVVVAAEVSGAGYVGGVGGSIEGGTITDSYTIGNITGTISSSNSIGGFVGAAACGAVFTRVYATGNVMALGVSSSSIGGFVGGDGCSGPGGIYNQAYATGNVTGNDYVGGFIGFTSMGEFNQVYATGGVTGGDSVGGLIGEGHGNFDDAGTVKQSFSTGTVTGNDYVGGLVGNGVSLIIRDSYSRSVVNGSDLQAGFVGLVDGADALIVNSYSTGSVDSTGEQYGGFASAATSGATVEFSFWDTQTSSQSSSAAATGKNTSEMKTLATFTDDLEDDTWDFDEIWGIDSEVNDGYPCLRWVDSCSGVEEDVDDGDGITTEVEDGAPNTGDGNDDGTPDSEQANVSSFVSSVTGEYVTIALPDTCSLTSVGVASEESKPSVDETFSYPNGLLGFSADCGTPGVSVTVQQWFFNAGSASGFVARKYTAYNDVYQTLDGAAVTDATVGGVPAVKLMFSLTDGGQLDNDQEANGIIIDPAGLGVAGTTATGTSPAAGTLPATGVNLASHIVYSLLILLFGTLITLFAHKKVGLAFQRV